MTESNKENEASFVEELRLAVMDWIRNFHPKPDSDLIKDGNEEVLKSLKKREIIAEEIQEAILYLRERDPDCFINNSSAKTTLEVAIAARLIVKAIHSK